MRNQEIGDTCSASRPENILGNPYLEPFLRDVPASGDEAFAFFPSFFDDSLWIPLSVLSESSGVNRPPTGCRRLGVFPPV